MEISVHGILQKDSENTIKENGIHKKNYIENQKKQLKFLGNMRKVVLDNLTLTGHIYGKTTRVKQ